MIVRLFRIVLKVFIKLVAPEKSIVPCASATFAMARERRRGVSLKRQRE